MHFAYGIPNSNSREARCIYAERCLQYNLPCRQKHLRIFTVLGEKSSFVRNTVNLGKLMTVRTLVLESCS